jgi:leucyl-tRNA synthetase
LYARFYTKALADLGLGPADVREPFARLFTQGMITMDHAKMSKSRGNVITPERFFDSVGADALRLFHLFVGPPAEGFNWDSQTDQMIEGCQRFLARLWRVALDQVQNVSLMDRVPTASDLELEKETHRLIDRVSSDLDRWSYNTAVAAAMEFLNTVYKHIQSPEGAARSSVDFAVDSLVLLLAPMVPHITAELWERRQGGVGAGGGASAGSGAAVGSVHAQAWPVADPALVRVDTMTMVVQVNGKVRDRVEVDASIEEDDAVALALASPKVAAALAAGQPKKVVARPPRLVNVVV